MHRTVASAFLALVAALAVIAPVRAGQPVVVELFTSQGCSSCPPADQLLARLAEREDVIALALHVDYWDYLGWQDTFAEPKFTARQQAYRDAWSNNVVFTPQMVVQGRRDVPATDAKAVAAEIARARSPDPVIDVSIEAEGGMLKCRIAPGPEPVTGTVWMAKYDLSETVEITRGENAGRTMTYHNVVTSLMRMGEWSGSGAEEVEMPHPDPGEGVAVWIQKGRAGPILAAAKVEKPAE